ncbi:MAG: UDP-N-acetylmuramate dehydrogenase [Desulfobacterales bacterium]
MLRIVENGSLLTLNTFGVPASARYLVPLRGMDEVMDCIDSGICLDQSRLILGGGSNLLLTRDFPGVVLKPEMEGIRKIREDADRVWIQAAAGENWDRFVRHCIRQGWYGLENLVRIPGLVGACPVQNVGAYGIEIETFFDSLETVDLEMGSLVRFSKEDCRFGYRSSRFKEAPRDRYLITSVTFRLHKSPALEIGYSALAEELRAVERDAVSPRDVADAVDRLRQRRLPDPETLGNAGSFFKNPIIDAGEFAVIRSRNGSIPAYPTPDGRIKVAAGWLIEQCGWKGRREGRCGVYDRQALILVNHGGATGEEILELSLRIQASVMERFGIRLDPEPRIL